MGLEERREFIERNHVYPIVEINVAGTLYRFGLDAREYVSSLNSLE